jgi:8-oxo-dGTP pyrophosphatase MutT (NUDIX family)
MWIIVDKNLNILLVNNPKRWIWLPWWHIELNESTKMCIIREIEEETWINIDTLSYLWFNEIVSDKNIYLGTVNKFAKIF